MTAPARLPPELISLVHHVELNKAGWWDKAIQQLILATIWLSGQSLTADAVRQKLRDELKVDLDRLRLASEIDALCASDVLVAVGGDQLKISEQSLREFEEALKEGESIEKEAHDRFIENMRACCPDADAEATWRSFNDGFLLPLIHETGARTYELISGTTIHLAGSPRLQGFLDGYANEVREPLSRAVIEFMDPTDLCVRSYILRQLCAYFLLEAGNLREETVQALSTMQGKPPSFTLLVDTNFLFCILGLDQDAWNEAARSLMDLAERLAGNVALRLRVCPATIDEARWVLKSCEHELAALRLTPNLADAALRSGLSGLARKFIEENKKAGRPLRAEDYFGPYIENLVGMARAKGVELSDQKVDHYRTSQEVVDDLNEQLEFEKRFRDRPKGYKQLEHDIVLWHFVRDQRPVSVDSPADAGCWIATLDYGFLAFDRYKRRQRVGEIPICVHPATLMQMLQFWVPRTQDFEEAVLGNLRLPFLFQEFGPDAERLTIRILDVLSRFENIDDLPQEAMASTLMNSALRQRLEAETDVEKDPELVSQVFVEENRRLSDELSGEKAKTAQLKREAHEKAEAIAQLQREEKGRKEAVKESQRQLEDERTSRRSAEAALRKKEEQEQITWFAVKWVIAPLALIVALGLGVSLALGRLTQLAPLWSALTAVGICSVSLILWVGLTDSRGSRDAIVSQWRPFSRFHGFKKWLFAAAAAPAGAVGFAVLGNALWELIKHIW